MLYIMYFNTDKYESHIVSFLLIFFIWSVKSEVILMTNHLENMII